MQKIIYHTTVNIYIQYTGLAYCMKGMSYLVVVDEEGELFLSEESCLPHVHAVLPIEELDY